MDEYQLEVFERWNRTKTAYPRDSSIHALFEAQATRTPDAIAARFAEMSLSYSALNARANQLAHHLTGFGVEPGSIVGISLERSPDLLVGLLAVLKAGGAYLPIDPDYPDARMALMIEDAGIDVLLTEKLTQPRFNRLDVATICLDADADFLADQSTINPRTMVTAESRAYVMYTSGSTGQPKGVCVSHRNVVRLVQNTNYVQLGPEQIVLQFAPVSFDAATFEIWGCLLNGGELVIHPPGLPSLDELGRFIEGNRITTLWLTAGLFHQMVDREIERLHGVRQLLAGGDVLSPVHVRKALDTLENCTVINGYGPTECTTFSCCHPMTDSSQVGESVSIGRPVSNTQVYVVDRHMNRVPVGVEGELWIGGDGVAQGYLNDPDLTEQKFVPNPFVGGSTQRLYRTGDICKWREDGTLEFIGRRDHQVKIRGFRIELGEIETALLQAKPVRQTTVLAREDRPGTKRLVAYVVLDKGSQVSDEQTRIIRELRAHLAERLPRYMCPSAYVVLTELPLTTNGKLDRRALPPPDESLAELSHAYVAPRTETERRLASIWKDVLGVTAVGVNDNFFEMGGDSLVATEIISRIRDEFGGEASMRLVLNHPTINGLARQVDDLERIIAPSIGSAQLPERIPLSFAQQRLWVLEQLHPGTPANNIHMALRFEGDLDVRALEQSIGALIERHEPLRTSFEIVAGKPYQVVQRIEEYTLEVVPLEHLANEDRNVRLRDMIQDETLRVFDLVGETPLRCTLFTLSNDEQFLLIVLHHIAGDGWSFDLFFHELTMLYDAFRNGVAPPLPPLAIRYADFSVWEQQWHSDPVIDSQKKYWLTQVKNLPTLEFPLDQPRPAAQHFRGTQLDAVIPVALTEKIKALAKNENATLFMVLLATFAVSLHGYTNQTDLAVGSPIANRNRRETGELIGCFVNLLVLRVEASGDPTFRKLLKRVRETCLSAFANQDYPFDRLVAATSTDRDLRRNPMVQVLFALQSGMRRETTRHSDLKITRERIEFFTSRVDLEFNIYDDDPGLVVQTIYNTELFERESIEQFVDHWFIVLENVVSNPDFQISELLLRCDATRGPTFHGKTATTTANHRGARIHASRETQMEPTSDESPADLGYSYVDPKTQTERDLAAVWEDVLGIEPIGVNDNFFVLGGDSLLATEIIHRVRDEFGIDVSVRDLFDEPTIGKLAFRANAAGPSRLNRPGKPHDRTSLRVPPKAHQFIEVIRVGSEKPPFFCATGAGSTTGYFARLASQLDPEQPFYGLRDPSLENKPDTYPTVEALADQYLWALKTIQPQGPYRLGGWSFGGVVAFEMAQRLIREGEKIAALIMIDAQLPNSETRESISFLQSTAGFARRIKRTAQVMLRSWPLVCGYLRDSVGVIGKRLTGKVSPSTSSIGMSDYVAWAWHDMNRQCDLKDHGLADIRFRSTRLTLIEDPFICATFRGMKSKKSAILSYDWKTYPESITLIRSKPSDGGNCGAMGWDNVALGGVEVHTVDASHEALLRDPYVESTANVLQRCLDYGLVDNKR